MTENNKPAEQEIKTDKQVELTDLSQELSDEEMEEVEGGARPNRISPKTKGAGARRYA
ncbi:hypothetical protein [Paenibacillus turpanensis]|uniref:hypothetical protein n=1 Tax=Paenibacillus turpanensis TaxID=2689078 RepID=UPI0014077458|nr:hypothetical protein [Paenibacillus turpanensis]